MGCGWPGQDQTPMETLLPEHTGMNVSLGFQILKLQLCLK